MAQPNIVLIFTDDQEVGTIKPAFMPYLTSQPFGSWVEFSNSALVSPLCGIARASLFTGQQWQRHGVSDHGKIHALDETDTIFTALKAAGYHNIAIGKWENKWPDSMYKTPSGPYLPPGVDDCWLEVAYDKYFGWEMMNTDLSVDIGGTDEADYLTDRIALKALELLDNRPPGTPFFLYVSPNSPHGPQTPAPRHVNVPVSMETPLDWNQADLSGHPQWLQSLPVLTASQESVRQRVRREQRQCCMSLDEMVEDVLTYLDSEGLIGLQPDGVTPKTIILYQTDNGIATGRKRIREHTIQKAVPYYYARDALLRIHYPGATQRTEPAVVSTLDITAAIMAWTGASMNHALEGRDLTPLLVDQTPIRDATLLTLDAKDQIPAWNALLTERWLYVEWASGERGLFYRPDDPAEMVNVYTPELAAPHAVRLAELLADPASQPEPAARQPSWEPGYSSGTPGGGGGGGVGTGLRVRRAGTGASPSVVLRGNVDSFPTPAIRRAD